jgi:hypothetical protein
VETRNTVVPSALTCLQELPFRAEITVDLLRSSARNWFSEGKQGDGKPDENSQHVAFRQAKGSLDARTETQASLRELRLHCLYKFSMGSGPESCFLPLLSLSQRPRGPKLSLSDERGKENLSLVAQPTDQLKILSMEKARSGKCSGSRTYSSHDRKRIEVYFRGTSASYKTGKFQSSGLEERTR